MVRLYASGSFVNGVPTVLAVLTVLIVRQRSPRYTARMSNDREQKKAPREHVAFRIDPDLRNKLEALRADLHTPWKDATISDVLRMVVFSGIEEVQRKRADARRRDPIEGGEERAEQPRRSRRGQR